MAFKPAFKPTPVKQPKLTPTKQQETIINLAKEGNHLAIRAAAGSSKTTTCIMVAEEVKASSLYIAFNKSIADEASTKFPSHVECRTVHSLAYAAVVSGRLRKKLASFFDFKDIDVVILPDLGYMKEDDLIEFKIQIAELVKGYCHSASLSLPAYYDSLEYEVFSLLGGACQAYWNNLVDENNPSKITHDVYLKMWHLTNPKLDYSVIYLDEAQDSNPVVLDIVLQQKAQLIIVGDEWQAIYEWRGAINAFDTIESMAPDGSIRNTDDLDDYYGPAKFTLAQLTESFRFTQEIADMASKLTAIGGATWQITGKAIWDGEAAVLSPYPWSKAIIVRNNATLLAELLAAEQQGKKVRVMADLADLWKKMYHIQNLYFENPIKFPDRELAQYHTYNELAVAAKGTPELNKLMTLTIQLSVGSLYKNIEKIKTVIVTDKQIEAGAEYDYTLTTAHKSKGLEWDEVTLVEDLFSPLEGQDDIECLMANQTLNLLYVALTRAKYKINLPVEIQGLIDNYEDYRELWDNMLEVGA